MGKAPALSRLPSRISRSKATHPAVSRSASIWSSFRRGGSVGRRAAGDPINIELAGVAGQLMAAADEWDADLLRYPDGLSDGVP